MRHAVVLILALSLLVVAGTTLAAQSAGFTPFVALLRAVPHGSAIELSWKDSPDVPGTNLIYRSTSAITTATIDSATLVGTVPTGTERFIDHPPDAQGYFYAVVVRDGQGRVYRALVEFRNITSAAVSIPQEAAPATVSVPQEAAPAAVSIPQEAAPAAVSAGPHGTTEADRDSLIPLLDSRLSNQPWAAASRPLSPVAEEAIAELMRMAVSVPREAGPARTLERLPAGDFDATAEGALLADIVAGPLARGAWQEAKGQLESYLAARRSAAAQARGRFYLGQALWFLGSPRDAFFEFLQSEGDLPRESRAWEDACVEALAGS